MEDPAGIKVCAIIYNLGLKFKRKMFFIFFANEFC